MHVGEQPETTTTPTTTRTTIIEIQVEIKMEIKTLPKMAVQRVKTASHNHLFVCIILVVPPPPLTLSAILCRILFLDVFHSSLQQQKKTTNIHNKHEWVYDICNI